LPESNIQKRKANISTAINKHFAAKKTLSSQVAKGLAKKKAADAKAGVVHRCPECMDKLHRSVIFSTPVELGKHRRFKHGVLGRNHAKGQEAKARVHGLLPGQVTCEVEGCGKTFKNAHGLLVHKSTVHKPQPTTALAPTTSQELMNGNGSTQTQTINGHEANGRSRTHVAATAEALAIANGVGHIENLLLTIANRYDVPPRQFARRVIVALGERYSQEW